MLDPGHKRAFEQIHAGTITSTTYAVDRTGTYDSLIDPISKSAVKMMKKPGVRYEFTADKKFSLKAFVQDEGASPASVLTDDVTYPGTETANEDGTTDFEFKSSDGTTATLHVSEDGVLAGAVAKAPDLTATLAFGYGAQTVALPAASATISAAELAKGITYLDMSSYVKGVADDAATASRKAAKGHTVKVTAVRKSVQRSATSLNKALKLPVVKVKTIGKGAKVYATNPWTHKTVTYTVEASGNKVTVHKK